MGFPRNFRTGKIDRVILNTTKTINKQYRNSLNLYFKPLKINNLYVLECCKITYKHIQQTTLASFQNYFTISNHGHFTRHFILNALRTIRIEEAGSPVTFSMVHNSGSKIVSWFKINFCTFLSIDIYL